MSTATGYILLVSVGANIGLTLEALRRTRVLSVWTARLYQHARAEAGDDPPPAVRLPF